MVQFTGTQWHPKLFEGFINKNSRGELVYIRVIQGHTGGKTIMPELIGHVSIPSNWKEFIFHRGCSYDHRSITETGLVVGGKGK